jgi:hypothetical protein
MKKKNQKPIEIDVHFKYRCPKSSCGYDHWLSLKETQTKNFKIVCDCGNIFKPKQIKKLKIVFYSTEIETKPEQTKVIEKPKIPIDLRDSSVRLLVGYGFTKEEAFTLVEEAYSRNPVTSGSLLVKYVLQNLEQLNVNN